MHARELRSGATRRFFPTKAEGKTMQFIDLKAQYAVLKPEIDRRIQTVLDHGQFIMGPEVRELEERLEALVGARHCVTVASGTEALLIAMMALGIKPGDEVITTPFTFVATAEMIVLLGAKPVFVDIDPATCNIDASRIEEHVTPRTRAIMPVSLYGQPADMDEINRIAERHGLPVIEDAAQSFGAEYKGRKSCNLSTIGCTSFFPSKPLGCYGDGGAIFTSDDALAKKMREIRVHGQERRYYHTSIGVGGRMDTLQCAVVLGKLERFEWEVGERKRKGERYLELLKEVPGVATLSQKADRTSVWAQFTVVCEDRADLQRRLGEQGIPTAIHYPVPLHLQPAYQGLSAPDACPVSIAMGGKVLSLPMSADLSELDQDRVVSAVRCAAQQRIAA
jgi:UDP-2-acetamido-2-deoxy-ribo-hexuluronate aminotransferase